MAVKDEVSVSQSNDGMTHVTLRLSFDCNDGAQPSAQQIIDAARKVCMEHEAMRAMSAAQTPENGANESQQANETPKPQTANDSTNEQKVELFASLFRGRSDVYARRWEGKESTDGKSGRKSGYSPVCRNEWAAGVCKKPRVKCAECASRSYVPFDKLAVARHLAGREVAGVYPMLADETCLFLAADFDDDGWMRDASAFRAVCERRQIPVAVERSRSGNGAHVWVFFDAPVSAVLARRLGSAVLTAAMEERHELKFNSYDRLFPNQDTMPKGGFGNLIALPLQRAARADGNSVFIDAHGAPHPDQWAFLSGIRRLGVADAERHIAALCKCGELGGLRRPDEEDGEGGSGDAPWQGKARETHEARLVREDFPAELRIVEANMIYIAKEGVSQRALNRLKRLAAFKNPEFYKAQAMRFPTWDKPRVISISDETAKYLCLPRGCKADVARMIEDANAAAQWRDGRENGRIIEAAFNGVLRDEQDAALRALLAFDNGVLSATTAFGKTVVAAALIAARKVSTLVLVNRRPLLDQWKARLAMFLRADEKIGQLGGGKNSLGGMIDIAIIQSLARGDEVSEIVRNYGMVIVDECHHISAVSFERVLKETAARYVYGLTATPKRQDGHHPIITMHCGQIRYNDDAKLQAQRRPFEHFVIPRFTSLRIPIEADGAVGAAPSIQKIYAEICQSESRNDMIAADIIEAAAAGRNALVLTERKSHVETLEKLLRGKAPAAITLVGGKSTKERNAQMSKIDNVPADQPLVIIATGKYVGEGFDAPRLDTLFLAMPIAWQGTLSQYVGRLHRLHDAKREARVYDYVDIHIAVLDRMYAKRVKGYAALGYKTKNDASAPESANIIFDATSFLPIFTADLLSAKRNIAIVSPFALPRRTLAMLETLDKAAASGAKITIVTRPASDVKPDDAERVAQTLTLLRAHQTTVLERAKIHQKFAIIDERIIWYGSINILSFGGAEESMMRLESKSIAGELLKIL
jgi:Uncharacterized protein conserved in bacteria